jgi:hypothetical protein
MFVFFLQILKRRVVEFRTFNPIVTAFIATTMFSQVTQAYYFSKKKKKRAGRSLKIHARKGWHK